MSLNPGKYRVGVLGATGAVGQRFIQLLETHPWFEVAVVAASERSAGKRYSEAANWKVSASIPAKVRDMVVQECDAAKLAPQVDIVFSGLDASVAGEVETALANLGVAVFSNAKNHRMDVDVPILIPQINAEHVDIVRQQGSFRASGGFVVTNANCSSTGLSVALAPIHQTFGITHMAVATLQAVSGAGYPGLPSLDILDNCIPYISGEEPKLEEEPNKILGTYQPGAAYIKPAAIRATAMCHRVAVTDGHTVSVTLKLADRRGCDTEAALVAAVTEALASYRPDPLVGQLPSCPPACIIVRSEPDRPQPRLDRMEGGGMATVVGRVRGCPLFDVRMTTLAHNTVLGAAGGSLLNAELAVAKGLVNRT